MITKIKWKKVAPETGTLEEEIDGMMTLTAQVVKLGEAKVKPHGEACGFCGVLVTCFSK